MKKRETLTDEAALSRSAWGLSLASVLLVPGVVVSGFAQGETADTSAGQLQEVIVSARKKDERLVDVPASVDVISAEVIDKQRIESVDNLFGKVPSLYFSRAGFHDAGDPRQWCAVGGCAGGGDVRGRGVHAVAGF